MYLSCFIQNSNIKNKLCLTHERFRDKSCGIILRILVTINGSGMKLMDSNASVALSSNFGNLIKSLLISLFV